MANNGGARPGAGRKPKAVKYVGQITDCEDRIADRLPELIDNLFELAKGVTIQETDNRGNERVYTRAPDFKANQYLVDRILGKPTERVEHSGDEGGPVQLTTTVLGIAANELTSWRQSMIGNPSSSPSA